MNIEQKTNSNTSPAIAAMQCYAQPSIQLFNCDNRFLMQTLADESVDVILTDPPYLYLKNQKLEREFDEQLFFSECKRVLTKDGFIVMFGRGSSFYRWNTILDSLGFTFKEEIIWDKSHCTSPLMAISRVHETISIHSKGKGTLNKVKIPYLEMKSHNLDSIVQDVNRIKGALNNTKSLENLINFLKNNANNNTIIPNRNDWNGKISKNEVTASNGSAESGDRSVSCLQTIKFGLNEKSIIKQIREHYKTIHPTQKPVRLLERLLALVVPKDKEREDIVVADFFGGSFSTMEAVYNMGMQGIATEIDKEYYDLGKERIEKLPPRQTSLFP